MGGLPLFLCNRPGMQPCAFTLGRILQGKYRSGKREVKNWKGGCKSIGRIINKWDIFHVVHTMTGSEEMSGGYGWKKD